jgi:putative component of membrane protein insertase Oxa1/YidC/SpoIIIJ protein YidD
LALEKYGFIMGWYLSIKRIMSCKRSVRFGTVDYP